MLSHHCRHIQFKTIAITDAGLVLQPDSDNTARLCQVNGTRLDEPLPQPQHGILDCLIECSGLIYDWQSESLFALDSLQGFTTPADKDSKCVIKITNAEYISKEINRDRLERH